MVLVLVAAGLPLAFLASRWHVPPAPIVHNYVVPAAFCLALLCLISAIAWRL
jgi:hypothetical protein